VRILVIVLTLVWAAPVTAGEKRNSTVRRQFLQSMGLTHTPKGCQVDHWLPLFCGGKDERENLRLICGDYMQRKERIERKCDRLPQWVRENPCNRNLCINPRE
jgi:hypothetical protein